jgi:hypothetical protein
MLKVQQIASSKAISTGNAVLHAFEAAKRQMGLQCGLCGRIMEGAIMPHVLIMINVSQTKLS